MANVPLNDGPVDVAPADEDISVLRARNDTQLPAIAAETWEGGTGAIGRISEMGVESGQYQKQLESGEITAPDVPIYTAAAPTTPEIPIAEAQKRIKGMGLDQSIKLPDQPTIRAGALKLMIDHAQTAAERQDQIARGPQGIIPDIFEAGTSLFVGAVDPVNIAAFSVPVLGEARYAKLLASAGESVLARGAVRAGVGGVQGALGGALLTPIEWAADTGDGRDYTMTDALSNIIQTAGAGALFHSAFPLAGEAYRKARGRPLEPGEPAPAPTPAAEAEPGAAPPRPPISTGIPMVDDVLEAEPVRQAIETPNIDRDHDVPYGAGSAEEGPGKTYVDRHVPREAEVNGVTFDPAIAVNVHEQAERFAMEQGMSYQQAHEEIATPAEKAWVEANLGPNAWEPYTRLWDGWLSHIEHENAENPPLDLYAKPYPHDQRLALETKGQDQAAAPAGAEAVRAAAAPVARETQSPMAATFDALPDRAKEDMARIVNADLIAGRPVQGAEVLEVAARTDPRIAQALQAFERDPSAQEVLRDVRAKLVAAGRDPEEATVNATVWAARYSARASRTGRGSAMELYQSVGMQIAQGASALEGRSFNQPATAPTFHSAVERAVTNSKLTKGSPEQWLATVKNTPGVKPEEMKWLGLEDWLKEQDGPVTKDQVAQYVNDNNIQVNEVTHGLTPDAALTPEENARYEALTEKRVQNGLDGLTLSERGEYQALNRRFQAAVDQTRGTKYGSYTLPGGENYRELLLTLPQTAPLALKHGMEIRQMPDGSWNIWDRNDWVYRNGKPTREAVEASAGQDEMLAKKEQSDYRSSHWDEPNILAHIRFDDRTVDGQKALHIAEVQSDWHQAGRRRGYKSEESAAASAERDRLLSERDHVFDDTAPGEPGYPEAAARYARMTERIAELFPKANESGVPDAPFKTSWPELSMKRMIRYAAENGYDRITWDTGATNAERYDLAKQVSMLRIFKHENGTYDLQYAPPEGGRVQTLKNAVPEGELEGAIGKDLAKKAIEQTEPSADYSGLDLKVGGEGMRGFYDKILPTAVNKLVKKFGGKVEESKIDSGWDRSNYSGPELSPAEIRSLIGRADSVAIERQLGDIANARTAGESMKDAVEQYGSFRAAEILGGELIPEQKTAAVHSLAITPAMKEAALSEGFPLFQGGGKNASLRGRITLEDIRAIINLFENADHSTFMHESAHLWLDELARDAATDGVPQALKEDFGAILRWLGADRAEDITVEQHEKFATGFEQYLASGRAPSSALERAFAAFKDWLTAIYRDLRGLGAPISDDVRGVFDRMLTPAEHERIDQASPPPRARRGNAQNLASQPQTLIGFLKSRGGLKDSSEFKGRDYRASYPGLINNKRGMTLDYAREAAAEAGYLGGNPEEAMSQTTVADFLNALENHPTYSVRDEGRVTEWRQKQEFAEYRRQLATEKANLEEFAERHEMGKPDEDMLNLAADLIISKEEHLYDNALERAAIMLENRHADEEARLAEAQNEASKTRQEPGGQPAGSGGPGARPGSTGAATGPRQAVSELGQARREAEWRAIAERSHPAAGGDIGDGGLGDTSGESVDTFAQSVDTTPVSVDTPAKQMSALEKAVAEAEEQWKALEPYLDEDERAKVAEELAKAGADEQAHADALKDLLNCMIVAEE